MIKAFLICKNVEIDRLERSVAHLAILAKRFSMVLSRAKFHGFEIALVSAGGGQEYAEQCAGEFILGNLLGNPHSWDRFLNIKITAEGVVLENDYAGSIPVFYSERDGLAISNIEPCVYIASDTTLNDLSLENLYGFMHFSHFIWDETAWLHIFQILPDARYRFSTSGRLQVKDHLKTLKISDERHGFSDVKVAEDLYQLNKQLVTRSLSDAEEIILPLSSGYDSRMIFAVLANDEKLRKKTRCFTYGSRGSIEVEAGRRLTKRNNIAWEHIELPCQFLNKTYLNDVWSIFGASVHMHGMYQIEFYEQIKSRFGISSNTVFTSGFMTGVPAGQHNSLLGIVDEHTSLSGAMNRFAQSNFWSEQDLEKIPAFSGKNFLKTAENRFRAAFDRVQGGIQQKSVVFDVLTRQRNFISYYPRTLEWLCPVSSPHMNSDYANFFLSLDNKQLINRRAVELMFEYHYPEIGSVPSNSNGLAAIGSEFENFMLLSAKVLNKFSLGFVLPQRYQLNDFEFNLNAVKKCGDDSFYPFFDEFAAPNDLVEILGGNTVLEKMRSGARQGELKSYARFLTIQSVALDLLLCGRDSIVKHS